MLKLRNLSVLTSMVSGTRSKTVSAVSTITRLDKMMKKMKKKDERSDKWFLTPLSSQKGPKHHTGKARYSTAGTKRKAEHISNLLFGPISQIMCRGVLDSRIKVELSQVSILADFSLIKVHWLASDKDDHILTEGILQKKAVALQDLVKELQIISNVPPVKFVKDMSLASVQEVERLLQQVDLDLLDVATDSDGETTDSEITETRLEIPEDIPVSTAFKDISKRFSSEDTSYQVNEDENTDMISSHNRIQPTDLTNRFRQDLYGIDHEAMMQKLKTLKSGLRKKTTFYEVEPEIVQTNIDRKQVREQYAKMLQIQRNQRQILRKERKNKYNVYYGRDGNDDLEDFLFR
ncbi:putative ribosome-binding factor A, mitochondrial [Pecten maximus]|uniref:putative ribosome-binding factor A, mitochondrial n=1 Tax=Pecten maximus TaxID=6579 RepID=UPI001458E904|nr:putative ribosome-binding factor A, mitochondrial [Pecten maximus]